MKDIMLDLETWGKKPGCAIRSIGAVQFDFATGEIGDKFYCNVHRFSCEGMGLTIDPETALWWEKQSQASRDALEDNPLTLAMALAGFHAFFLSTKGERVWCQGATFDAPILEQAYIQIGAQVPWKYWNVRCTRTAYDLLGVNPKEVKREGTHHNALDDCLHQIKCLMANREKANDPTAI